MICTNEIVQSQPEGRVSLNIAQSIHDRRSIGRVKGDPVPKEMIHQLLDAAVWAPNHCRTEPWRFVVMTGEGRNVLGRAYTTIASEKIKELEAAEALEVLKKEENKAFRAPLVIAVSVSPSTDPKVERIEEFAAVHAAIQNMLLTAHSLGLASVWRSGDPMYHPVMKRAFELSDSDELVGLLYIGFPLDNMPEIRIPEPSYVDKTRWLE